MSQLPDLPPDYEQFLSAIKERVRAARLRAVAAANQELLRGYWEIGSEILRRQQAEGWGSKVIDRLAARPGRPGRALPAGDGRRVRARRPPAPPRGRRPGLLPGPAALTRPSANFASSGASVFTPDLPNGFSCRGPAVRLRHVDGFPALGLLRGLRHVPRPSAGIGPSRAATSGPPHAGRFPRSP